jgi:4-diphosphocytidyl-2-C-methyl-D-erythritol kinase
VNRARAPAKLNLALVVGPRRADGTHELATVFQRLDLADEIELVPAAGLRVEGFAEDTLVSASLSALGEAAGVEARWRARITKRIPVAAGLGGGSSDAATALRLANATLDSPLPGPALARLARSVGADVPYFLEPGPQLGRGDGSELTPLDLPQDYWVVLVLPDDVTKPSTARVYEEFDRGDGAAGFEERRGELERALAGVGRPRDLAALPQNDLASSPLADELRRRGAFRADVTGAGPTVYGLFEERDAAAKAARPFGSRGRLWIAQPAWYV